MSPDQKKAIALWADGARDALDSAEKLFAAKKYHHALFFCHLAVEKALKARYIAERAESLPYTHDVRRLAKILNLASNEAVDEFLAGVNTFNVAGRYVEEKMDLARRATPDYTRSWVDRTREFMQNLLP